MFMRKHVIYGLTDETKRKLSEIKKGNRCHSCIKILEKIRQKMSDWKISRKLPEETKIKISLAMKNRKRK